MTLPSNGKNYKLLFNFRLPVLAPLSPSLRSETCLLSLGLSKPSILTLIDPLIKWHQNSLTRGQRSRPHNCRAICHYTRLSGLPTGAAICTRHSLSGARCRHTHIKARLISVPASYLLRINKGSSPGSQAKSPSHMHIQWHTESAFLPEVQLPPK